MHDSDGHYIGSVTASLTLKWLSQAVTALKPYPNSSAIMVGRNGVYLAHPDTAKLFHETIFSDAAPESRRAINALGKAMLAGHSGMTETIVDGQDAFIFYTSLERTGWSIAIVCPASDIFTRYNRLFMTVIVIIAIGLLLLLLVCYQIVRRAIQPLHLLDEQAQRIADGVFEEPLPPSPRHDSLGRLTNSFILMQQSLATMVNDIRCVNEELEQHNEELASATQLKQETNRRKADFIHYMYHEIRTPLNIISGFAQVLTASRHSLGSDEVEDIMARMQESAGNIRRLTRQLEETANQQQVKT
jgi:sigma-B regulation protein RsbU (phosphoserine phosphatase)